MLLIVFLLISYLEAQSTCSNFGLGSDCCLIPGITCDLSGRVVKIQLQNTPLNISQLPPETTFVSLENCSLSGPLFEFTQALTVVDLSRNELSGSVPNSISLSKSLTTLRLDSNRLSGKLPDLSKLTSLQVL